MKNPLEKKPIKVLKIGSVSIIRKPDPEPSFRSVPEPSLRGTKQSVSIAPREPTDRKELLINQVEREIAEVRYQRAQVHLKYRDLLNHELKPKASQAEFIMVYEEIETFSMQLKSLYLKKRQIELTGEYKAPRPLDDLTKNKIDALKNEKKRISDNKYKAQKLKQKAIVEGNQKNALKYEQKVSELDLKWMEAESRIDLLLK